jgi:hypothetical protein
MTNHPTIEALADYLLILYDNPQGRPAPIIANIWDRCPAALEEILRTWNPPAPQKTRDTWTENERFAAQYCTALNNGDDVYAHDLFTALHDLYGTEDAAQVTNAIAQWTIVARGWR